MEKVKIGLWGFGRTGKFVATEFLNDERFSLQWIVRKSNADGHKYASRLLGYEYDQGEIIFLKDVTAEFFKKNKIDVLVDFSDSKGIEMYQAAANENIAIVSAISKYEDADLNLLKSLAQKTAVLYSPNITLGINVVLIAAQIMQKIIPHADIEIVEEHFKNKPEISGTAKKFVETLDLNMESQLNSIRVGGIVGRHEVIFGMPNQTIRLSHESISRGAFGQGAIFASDFIRKQSPGLYTMEGVIAELFRQNIPLY